MEELTGLTQTKQELSRLTERTETLISILSGVDWQKVDPELVETRDELLQIQSQMRGADEGRQPVDAERVQKQVERLEEFVTSARFDYNDKASN